MFYGWLRLVGSTFVVSVAEFHVFASVAVTNALQVVPVFNYRRVDLLMRRWDVRQVRVGKE